MGCAGVSPRPAQIALVLTKRLPAPCCAVRPLCCAASYTGSVHVYKQGQDDPSNPHFVFSIPVCVCCAGDKVVTFRYGQFSHLWIDMMQRLGLDVTVIDRPWGEGADEAILQVRDSGQAGINTLYKGAPVGRLDGVWWAGLEMCACWSGVLVTCQLQVQGPFCLAAKPVVWCVHI